MSKIILPIKPQFVLKILNGEKLVEYRKVIPKRKDVSHVIIYATSPICRIVGEFELVGVTCDSPLKLWSATCHIGGITKEDYLSYFSGVDNAYALQIGTIVKYKTPRKLVEYGINYVPQGFVYVN